MLVVDRVRVFKQQVQDQLKKEFNLMDLREFLNPSFKKKLDAYIDNFNSLDDRMNIIHHISRFYYTREMSERNDIIKKIALLEPKFKLPNKIDSYDKLRQIESYLSSISLIDSNTPLKTRYIVKREMESFEEKVRIAISEFSERNPVKNSENIKENIDKSDHLFEETEEYRLKVNTIFDNIPFNNTQLLIDMDEILSQLEISKEEEDAKESAIDDLQSIVRSILGDNASLHRYGSFASGFGTKGCDVDLCLQLSNCNEDQNDVHIQTKYLLSIQDVLIRKKREQKHIKVVQEVSRSRVPILRLRNEDLNVEMDLCMGTSLGVENTKLLKTYSLIHPKVVSLVRLIKRWAKLRKIGDASAGTLSSYSYVLMTFSYLQVIGLLPSLQSLINHKDCNLEDISTPHYLKGFDCRYFMNLKKLNSIWSPSRKFDDISLDKLFYGFFKYYHDIFVRNASTICIRIGTPLKKIWGSPISIEDPFEIRDLGSVVIREKAPLIFLEIERAYNLISNNASLSDVLQSASKDIDNTNIYASRKPDYIEYEPEEAVKKYIEDGTMYIGKLRANSKRHFEAYVTIENFEKDILIEGLASRNRAIHGDLVAIRIIGEVDGRYQGEIVRIMKRNSPVLFACTLQQQMQPGHFFMIPIEKVYPKICVPFQEFRKIYPYSDDEKICDYIYIVRLNSWKINSRSPKGYPVGIIGLKRDLWAQKRAIFIQHMPEMFEDFFIKNRGVTLSNRISPVKYDTSLDFLYKDWTNRRIFTIDPTESRDLDDALSIEKLPDCRYKIGVYIADVTRFLTTENYHDIEAQKRCTSIYMIDIVEHMLIPSLSQDEASILPNVPRYSMGLEWIMNENGDVDFSSLEFNKGKITSCCRLDYNTAQEIILGNNPDINVSNGFSTLDIYGDVIIMNRIAQNMRRRRKMGGAVSLDSNELYFKLEETGYPISVFKPIHNESHQLIEEFMLMANHLTGITLHNVFGDNAVLRRHVPPDYKSFMSAILKYGKSLNRLLITTGNMNEDESIFDVDIIEKSISNFENGNEQLMRMDEAMNLLVEACAQNEQARSCIRHALLREMTLGTYAREGDCVEESKTHHFALNMDFYTHFTSPIRRYADVLVHRQINELLLAKSQNRLPIAPVQGEMLSNIIEKINEQSARAQHIDEAISKVYLSHYIAKELREGRVVRVKCVVMSCGKRSFTVFIEQFGTEVLCNIFQDLFITPTYVNSSDVLSESDDDSTEIGNISIVWSDPQNQSKIIREINIFPLKTIIVDLRPRLDVVPSSIQIYSIWEYCENPIQPVLIQNQLPEFKFDSNYNFKKFELTYKVITQNESRKKEKHFNERSFKQGRHDEQIDIGNLEQGESNSKKYDNYHKNKKEKKNDSKNKNKKYRKKDKNGGHNKLSKNNNDNNAQKPHTILKRENNSFQNNIQPERDQINYFNPQNQHINENKLNNEEDDIIEFKIDHSNDNENKFYNNLSGRGKKNILNGGRGGRGARGRGRN